jgi:isopenicillin N synthase-like dioxygenase
MPHLTKLTLPSFPSDVLVAKLNKISLDKLLASDKAQSAILFESCRTSGFFLLDLKGSREGEEMLGYVDRLFGIAEELYKMPMEDKQQYALRPGTAFGYVKILFLYILRRSANLMGTRN